MKKFCKAIFKPSQIPYIVESLTVVLLVIVTIVGRGTPLKLAKAFVVICLSFESSIDLSYTASTNLINTLLRRFF